MANEQADEADRQQAIEDYKTELLEGVRARGISDGVVGYTAFLRLTTFGPTHLGDGGSYALRMDGGEVAGIVAGPGCPVHHEFFAEIEMEAMADHHRDAKLNLPTTVNELINWVFKQVGDVELAIPSSDEYPVDPVHWVDAAMKIVIQGPKTGAREAPPPEKVRLVGRTREDAMSRELDSLGANSLDPKLVMQALRRNVGKPGSCVLETTSDAVKWKADDGTEKTMDMEALKKRLTRLNQKKDRR